MLGQTQAIAQQSFNNYHFSPIMKKRIMAVRPFKCIKSKTKLLKQENILHENYAYGENVILF